MSEAQNIEHVVKMYEAFGRGDIPYIIDQTTDDVKWLSRLESNVPWAGEFSGKANVGRFFEAIGANVEVTSFTPDEFVAQDDTVVSMGGFGFKANATGKSGDSRWVFIWKFRDGAVCSYEQFHEPSLSEAFR